MALSRSRYIQWQIQDFPERGGTNPNAGGGAAYYLAKSPHPNCMKTKENEPSGRP